MREEFQVHRLNENGLAKADELAEAFSVLLDRLDALSPPSPDPKVQRERALVSATLQTACFHAKRSIALRFELQAHPADVEDPVPVARVATKPNTIHTIAREINSAQKDDNR